MKIKTCTLHTNLLIGLTKKDLICIFRPVARACHIQDLDAQFDTQLGQNISEKGRVTALVIFQPGHLSPSTSIRCNRGKVKEEVKLKVCNIFFLKQQIVEPEVWFSQQPVSGRAAPQALSNHGLSGPQKSFWGLLEAFKVTSGFQEKNKAAFEGIIRPPDAHRKAGGECGGQSFQKKATWGDVTPVTLAQLC